MSILQSNSAEETQEIGRKISKGLRGGEVIFLSGILGAGKTVLVRGIANALGIKSKIPSPTFNIFRAYDIASGGKLYHFDCYRLKKYADLIELGWEEILADKKNIIVLEWPECIIDKDITRLPNKKVILVEVKIEGSKRIINILPK
ncbi:MAG: tRNA (adenosine(37)-N6)-threonylcarbamoyltransferase complex ATPase subunit type 1 TsaE [Candidatus Moraniibacteriota bacterium]